MKISIVTPSFNQGRYLARTMDSVLGQGYPDLEYIVIDGGSTDDSPALIARYADRLTYHISEPDGGQYDAVNKGFARSSGAIMAWLNSDDLHLPWTLRRVAEIFAALPDVQWLTTLLPLLADSDGVPIGSYALPGFARGAFYRGVYTADGGGGYIMQEGTFWRRSLWERAGGRLDTAYPLAADFELWARFFQHADLYGVELPLAIFRTHAQQASQRQIARYTADVAQVLARYGGDGRPPLALRLARRWLPGEVVRRLDPPEPRPIIRYDRAAGRWLTATR